MDPRAPIRFAAAGRRAQLEAMAARPLDVLVVGGGVTGAGVALDAAARGLRVGIVEQDDWACGTSSRSSKMIHGGLRYLGTGDITIVRESLRERRALQRNAAHLVRPLSMSLPAYGRGPLPWQRVKLGLGLWAYDLLGHRRASGSWHQWVGAEEFRRSAPGIAAESPFGGGRLRGAHRYHDDSADDVRLVLAVLRRAVACGAMAANGTRVDRLLRDGDRVVGALVGGDAAADAVGARDGWLELEARVVVNATGVWADRLLGGVESGITLLPSKGIHLTVPRERVGTEVGMAFFGQTDNSNVFVEPWQHDLAIVGTTDTPYAGELADPTPTGEEIDALLGTINQFLASPLRRDDVLSAWAGLRPLVRPKDEGRATDSEEVSRRHLLVARPGVVTIAGGKLTAYRSMAAETVDAVVDQLDGVEPGARRSPTLDLRLDGWLPAAGPTLVSQYAEALAVSDEDAAHLLRRHGANAAHLRDMVRQRPELRERVHPDRPYLLAEVLWAIRHEQARTLADVLERRTRIALETAEPQRAAVAIEELLAQERARGVGDVDAAVV